MTTLAPPAGIHIGPTAIPKRTLGWQILGWSKEYLLQPDGPDAGEPWTFTPEQARFILNWYAINERGRFVYRYGMYRRMKGHGKDPLGAALCCIEFVGPCRFARWDGGEPIAESHYAAWVQTAAVSRDQTRNTMTLFPGMLSRRAIEEFGIDLGKEIIYAHNGRCRIEAVTSSPQALGGPALRGRWPPTRPALATRPGLEPHDPPLVEGHLAQPDGVTVPQGRHSWALPLGGIG